MKIVKEIGGYVKARYPILYVVSCEEARAMNVLGQVAKDVNVGLWIWSVSDGLLDPKGNEVKDPKGESMVNPLKALRYIHKSQERAIFVFRDMHLFLEDPFPQYVTDPLQVRRVLRDIAVNFRTSFKTLFLLSPILRIPTELEKSISVFDLPLPSLEEIAVLLDETIADVKKIHGNKVTVNLDA